MAAHEYRCKHAVEAMRWIDTDDNREAFAAWFERNDAEFETYGHIVTMPDDGVAAEGEWVLWSHGEFVVMDDESFNEQYQRIEVSK